jgi:predicted N-acetyltransferase YhbS
VEIRRLRTTDDREQFCSGDPDLDRFFRRYAGQNQFRHHLGMTYVAVDGGDILGYVTIAPGSIEIDGLPAAARRGLPRYPLPVLRLARLAVDVTRQGLGVGKELLGFVLGLTLSMAEDYGCVGVVVDAKPGAVSFYARHGFTALEAVEGQSEARPPAVPMFLATSEIRAAARRSPSTPSR